MEQFKRAKVIMLETNQQSSMFSIDNILYKYYKAQQNVENINVKNQHLYIISDDEIKEGDWFIDITLNNYGELYQSVGCSNNKGYENWIKSTKNIIKEPKTQCKKIIATTNTSLFPKLHIGEIVDKSYPKEFYNILPQPSQQFIEKYIESYNKSEIITDVLVEYEYLLDDNTVVPYWKFKVNPKNNTITIKKVKDSYTKEEVLSFGLKCGIAGTLAERNRIDFNKLYLELVNTEL